MNDQLQEQLARILSAIQVATKAGADFALEQLPDIAQQYLLFGRVKYSVLFVLFVAIFFVMIFITFKYGFPKKEELSSWSDTRIGAAIFGTMASVIFLLAILDSLQSLLLVWLAPKVWLLQALSGLIRK